MRGARAPGVPGAGGTAGGGGARDEDAPGSPRDPIRAGRHVGIAGGLLKAISYGQRVGCRALQVFPGNPTGWRHTPLDPLVAERVRRAARDAGVVPLVIHAPYIINVAGPDAELAGRSREGLANCLRRAAEIGAADIVFHVGSHRGSGVAAGMERVVGAVGRLVAEDTTGARLLLENSVGAGHTLGGDFGQLSALLAALPPDRVGLCLDTAHVWGAGHDISTPAGAAALVEELERTVGLAQLRVVHLNDSAVGLGSRRDVHARLGEGHIGLEGLSAVLTTLRQAGAAPTVLLETPDDGPPREEGWQAVVGDLLAGDVAGALARQRDVMALPIERGSFPDDKRGRAF